MKRLLIITLLCTTVILSGQQHLSDTTEVCARTAFDYTNTFRTQRGLPLLQWHPHLATIAHKHSQDMGNNVIAFGHSGFEQRIKNLPFFVPAAAENLFMSNIQGDVARGAVDGWINSPGHLKNLVGNFTHCSIGVYKNAKGFWYFTQILCRL